MIVSYCTLCQCDCSLGCDTGNLPSVRRHGQHGQPGRRASLLERADTAALPPLRVWLWAQDAILRL